MTLNKHHLVGAAAATIVIVALLIAGFASHTLRLSGAASKTAIDAAFGSKQASVHLQGDANAPFLGPYHYSKGKKYECGPGIKLMEGALHHLPIPVRKGKAASCFGPATKAEIIVFQKRLHYKPTGVYNLATHRQLVKRGGYSKTAKLGLVYIYRKRVRAAQLLMVQHERAEIKVIALHVQRVGGSTLTYTQQYPQRQEFPAWPAIPPATDCSGMATYILYQDGVGAAVGYYGPGSPVGWTGTLRHQGQHISTTNTKYLYPGDLLFYHDWGHVAVYIGAGLVVSHGGTGVNILSYTYSTIDEVRRYIS
jgi:cell wall-associated NlpC family hydrolase